LDFASDCLRPGDVAYVSAGIRVYPGTRIAEVAAREGALPADGQGSLDPTFYLSPAVDLEWLLRELRQAAAHDPRIVLPSTLQGRLLNAARRAGVLVGLRQPLWRHVASARRLGKWLPRFRGR